jgi:hypothetical protein
MDKKANRMMHMRTSLHDIESIVIEKSHKLRKYEYDNTYARDIRINCQNGDFLELTLFSDDKSFLEIKNI